MKAILKISLLILAILAACTHSNHKQLPMGKALSKSQDTFKAPAAGQCSIACYTEKDGQYSVAGYYLNKGKYEGRICRPDNFAGDISSKDSTYSKKCASLPNCKTNICWAGGDTGGFIGK